MSSTPDTKKLLLVSAALITRQSPAGPQVLLTQRKKGSHLEDHWEFPGGKLHAGESPEEALIREIEEEVGLVIEALTPWRFVSHDYDHFHLLMTLFEVGRFQGEPQALDVAAVAWFTAPALKKLTFPPADEPLLAALFEQWGVAL
uniref:8-oxo-dGTP diphosphatase n=1 Tax=Magnetococcus massalia (strain MO-1) TaxID=451514 RepID=A0A1S7LKZ7_MAGMO|nr:putative nucleoside triphosphate pyrophosphohydrolase [Candidatus Magnetococcus massalia]